MAWVRALKEYTYKTLRGTLKLQPKSISAKSRINCKLLETPCCPVAAGWKPSETPFKFKKGKLQEPLEKPLSEPRNPGNKLYSQNRNNAEITQRSPTKVPPTIPCNILHKVKPGTRNPGEENTGRMEVRRILFSRPAISTSCKRLAGQGSH